MPGTTGRDLAQRLRASRPAMKVIYMSGYLDENVRETAVADGVPFVQKPFTTHALVKIVTEVLTTSV
jgi:FixJ family two-component response regulator